MSIVRSIVRWRRPAKMSDDRSEFGRRATDRPSHSTTSIESLAARATVGGPLLLRIFSSIGSMASTAVLALVGYAWTEVRDEWKDLKAAIAEIRHELDRQPSPEEFDKLRDKVEQINDRLIRMEARTDE